jgi:hypothetical protein
MMMMIFQPETFRKHTNLRAYKTLARPVLTCGSEAWTVRKQNEMYEKNCRSLSIRPYEKQRQIK